MRLLQTSVLAILVTSLAACASVNAPAAPSGSAAASAPLGSGATSTAAASLVAGASVPVDSPAPTDEPVVTPAATPRPSRKPRPSKKPTATPAATQPAIEGDIEVSIEQSSVPDPFYANHDYQIRVYISGLGQQDLPDVHVKLAAKDEGVSYKFDTGPIAITDTYYHDVTVNLPAYGPSALILSATMPEGYTDTNKANNTKSVEIFVTPEP